MIKSYYNKTKEFYNRVYEKYAANSGVVMHNAIDLFLKNVIKKGVIIDIGCGPGHDVEYMIDGDYEAIGIDFSEKMIEYAKNNHKGTFYCSDACNEDTFKNFSKIDGAWISAMLMHLSLNDQKKLLSNVNNYMTMDGVIGLIIPIKCIDGKKKIKNDDILFYFYEKDRLRVMLNEAHFKIVDFSTFQFNKIEWGVAIAKKQEFNQIVR